MTTLDDQGRPRTGRPTATAPARLLTSDPPTHGTTRTAGPGPDEGSRDDILPVILGGDVGAYSLARSFHEAYGVRSVVISPLPTGAVRWSKIVENVVEPQIDDIVCLVARLREIARSTSATCLLLGSTDRHVRQIVEHRARLDDLFVIPYPRREVLDEATDGERFSQLCAQLGIGHLATAGHDPAAVGTPMRILTCYSDRYGRVRLASVGQVLLGEHTLGLGGPGGVITTRDDSVVAQAVQLLEHLGWTGFSSFDITVDPVDGRCRFLGLSPRLGRSSYYVTASGHNPATYYVTEHVDGRDVGVLAPPDVPTSDDVTLHDVTLATGAHLCTVLPPRLLLSRLDGPLRVQTAALIASGAVTNPLRYQPERDPRRLAYLTAARADQLARYRRRPPRRSAPPAPA